MKASDTPRPAIAWALRALPVVAAVVVGLLARSVPAALLALVVGWVAAVLLARVWVRSWPTTPAAAAPTTLERAERTARAEGGFLAGDYALVGETLLRLDSPPGGTDDVTVRADEAVTAGQPRDGWIRTVPRHDVTGTYSYEARGRHVGGALLELHTFRDGRIHAAWWQVQDGRPNPLTSIPDGFRWEKNDDYYRGWVDPGDLTQISDVRSAG